MEVSNFQCHFTNILVIFLQHLFKIRTIPSPVKHKQTKTTHQQIQSHLKKVDVSDTDSKHSEWTNVPFEADASPAILKISWKKWRRKNSTRSWVLRSTPRSQKETEMTTSWSLLKPSHWTVFKSKENVAIHCTGHRGLDRGSLTTSQNHTECTFTFLLQRQRKVSASTTEESKAFHH